MPKLSLNAIKMLYGFALLGVMVIFAIGVSAGKVEDSNSFGPIITMLSTLAGAFAGWAFSPHPSAPPANGESEMNGKTPPATDGGTIKKVP